MKGNGKYYIALHGEVHEVSREVYQAYYQGKRKEKYIYEKDQAHENHILDISGMEELEAESNSCLASAESSIENQLLEQELHNHLHQCLQMLPEADQTLIQAIYFSGETESSYFPHHCHDTVRFYYGGLCSGWERWHEGTAGGWRVHRHRRRQAAAVPALCLPTPSVLADDSEGSHGRRGHGGLPEDV